MKVAFALAIISLGVVQILYFKDKTVVIYGPQDKVQIAIGSTSIVSSIDQSIEQPQTPPPPTIVLYRLPKSTVCHLPECRIVKDRPDRVLVAPHEFLQVKPCLICNPKLPQ